MLKCYIKIRLDRFKYSTVLLIIFVLTISTSKSFVCVHLAGEVFPSKVRINKIGRQGDLSHGTRAFPAVVDTQDGISYSPFLKLRVYALIGFTGPEVVTFAFKKYSLIQISPIFPLERFASFIIGEQKNIRVRKYSLIEFGAKKVHV